VNNRISVIQKGAYCKNQPWHAGGALKWPHMPEAKGAAGSDRRMSRNIYADTQD